MGDTGGFDLSKLAVGDEVGIEQTWADGATSQVVVMVTAVEEDGFEADCDWFDRDGRSVDYPDKRRLVAPTDEGRIRHMRESIPIDIDILGRMVGRLDLPQLRRLKAAVTGLILELGAET